MIKTTTEGEIYTRERRERIATAVLAGFDAGERRMRANADLAKCAVDLADALIAELDKEAADD